MATWDQLAQEMRASNPDKVRRAKLQTLALITGRPTILYAVEMYNGAKIQSAAGGSESISITSADLTGFREALRGVSGENLDVILHSPGGSPEATEAIVHMLRSRFTSIRFIIPTVAKSAATMMAMAGDQIILGQDAELGPTDPQIVINGKLSPAHAILAQFETAKAELGRNNSVLPAWLPILQQYGPSLLVQCRDAISLSQELVANWLAKYMFASIRGRKQKAKKVANFLADKKHLSHGRSIFVPELQGLGVNIVHASEVSPELLAALEDVDIAIKQTFQFTSAVKIFENSQGFGLYNVVQQIVMMTPQAPVNPTSPSGR